MIGVTTMNWINAFELMCYIIVTIMLVDLIRKKDYNSLFTFGAAALVGFTMELLAVAVTGIYYYNPGFWLNLGSVPRQFPVFGGLMWGGLTVYGIKLAKKLCFGKFLTALCAGFFIVTMDILLDVVAIRLDGGFWTWVGKPISTGITQSTFMSIIWVNFLGYMIETPAVVWLTLKKNETVIEKDLIKQTISMLLIALGAIMITIIGSLSALGLNALTNDWFSCTAFLLIWVATAIAIARQTVRLGIKPLPFGKWDIPMLIFWAAMYLYSIIAIFYLDIHVEQPWFPSVGVVFALFTFMFCVAKPLHSESKET